MTNYKKTGKYNVTPANTGHVFVGSTETTGYSGRSTRVDDNFTYLAGQTGGPQYTAGTGIDISVVNNASVISVDYADVPTINHTHTYSTITNHLTAGSYINIDANNHINVVISDILTGLSEATTSTKGLLSASDKTKLDGIATGANNYTLPIATSSTLGGIKVGSNLTINATTGVLDATDTTYADAIASEQQSGGYHGLMTAIDKEKLNSVAWGADNVVVNSTDNANGTIWINGNSKSVYVHPSYVSRTGVSETGKCVKDFSIDDKGHVINVIKGNEQGVSLITSGTGNVFTAASYLQPTLTLFREKLGNLTLGVINTTSTVYTDITANDDLALALKKLQNRADAKLHFRGTIGTGGTYPSIPSNKYNGDVYKIVSGMTLYSQQLVAGDMIIYDGPNTTWVVIPSGIRNTWRPISINGTVVRSSEPDSGGLNFAAGQNTTVSWDSVTGTIVFTAVGGGGTERTYEGGEGINVVQDSTYSSVYHINCTYTDATTSAPGLMSIADKTKLNGIAAGATAVIVDSSLSSSSTNPVQNSVIYTALEDKQKKLIAGNNISITGTNLDTINCTYSLPVATSSTLGGVKAGGSNITIANDGTISATTGTTYNAGNGISINTTTTPNSISAKVSADNGNAISFGSDNGLFCSGGGGSYTLPAASSVIRGGIKVGSSLSIANTDVLNVIVDNALSSSSTNPVQNSVINTALNGKQDKLPTVTNDRYLHTNATTGALEWSTVSSGTTYTAGNGINIANNTISAKVSSATGNVLTVSSDGLYCAGGGSVTASWGTITGTLANQTDLNTALSGKASNTDLTTHTGNSTIHVTSSDKSTWNNKQNALTAGSGINISSNTISIKSNADSYSGLTYDSNGYLDVRLGKGLYNETYNYGAVGLNLNPPSVGLSLVESYDDTYSLTLAPATSTTIGGVKPDGTTITIDANGVISSTGGGSGGTRINANNSLQSVNNSSTDTGSKAVLLANSGESKGSYSIVVGGYNNNASEAHSIIVGGSANDATSIYSIILGGSFNLNSGSYSTILGGTSNSNSGYYSVIVGSSNSTLSSNSNYSCLAGSLYGTTNQRGVIANCYNTVSGSGSTSLFRGSHSGFKGARVKTAYSDNPGDDDTLLYINTSDIAVIHLQYIAKKDYSDYLYSGSKNIRVTYGYLQSDDQWGDTNVEFRVNNGKLYIHSIASGYGEAEVGVWYTIYTGDGSSSSSSSGS